MEAEARPRLHPLAELYAEAERIYREAQARLKALRERLRKIETELEELEQGLTREYGFGYLTVKTVRNRSGRRYRYPVWRVPGRGDVYLTRDSRAQRILELREQVRGLRREITRLKHAARRAHAYMQAAREYRDTCITPNGEYVECPRGWVKG